MSKGIGNMKDSWFFDKNFNGLSDEVFDDVLKIFDFPLEDVEPNAVEEDWDAQFKLLEEPCFEVFSVSSSGLCDKTRNEKPQYGGSFSTSSNGVSTIKQPAEPSGPTTYEKTIPIQNVSFNGKDLHQFRTSSPDSVFEISSSSSVENPNSNLPAIPVKRARSKRRRPSSFSPLFSIRFFAIPPACRKTYASESDLDMGRVERVNKQKKRDLSMLSGHFEMPRSSSKESVASRKCTHCEVTKTPQWREGPLGPKTLCNACGVRYRSGRLFPEYRPAASPTFVASLHSNCHRKVIEMRRRGI